MQIHPTSRRRWPAANWAGSKRLLTKSSEEASHYGYRLYQYTSVADKRNQIVLIPQQAEG